MIPEDILNAVGAELKSFSKGELLFTEGSEPLFYYQIKSGAIKMNNYNDDGKEYIQGIFETGKSFGEPPLLAKVPYPANAEAIVESKIWRLPKIEFISLLSNHPDIHITFTTLLASRLYYKAVMVSEISNQEPEHRILRIIDYMKKQSGNVDQRATQSYRVDLTRQQLADLTGLRVETVIRTIKKLENKGELYIKNRKVYR
ncbi:Crp/Fnr family transcriptional regulator [Aquimarina intermedia]|uniref:CRP-like cAMP-binding protein n=1 Tax=Aquimarina intermedia TaxID=350814 RepID=A0A5S5C1C5_9FLAO|nr:Crp/Fnr family transcriptional regulator [Aquimarina intermedia]TYP72236.1 CRP-like cAMP-binding protein [Aquimarina intermedia]